MSDSDEIHCQIPELKPEPHGLIVISKPPGPTSFDCIRFLRRTCKLKRKWKIGHLGTLDPFASGVMVIALGQAVRYAEYALRSSKKYRARLWLGDETDTLDPTGEVIKSAPVPDNWHEHLDDIARKFTGIIEQVPPVYSAKQVDGRRSYEAARKNERLDLKPVEVEIYSLEFGEYTDEWVDFIVHVSGGTYIRSLGRDIAESLGTLGHLLGLERIQSGPFPLEEAIPFDAFEVGGAHVLMHHLRPVDQILDHLPSCVIRDGRDEKIRHGRMLTEDDLDGDMPSDIDDPGVLRIIGSDGKFRSLGRLKENGKEIVPFKPWLV